MNHEHVLSNCPADDATPFQQRLASARGFDNDRDAELMAQRAAFRSNFGRPLTGTRYGRRAAVVDGMTCDEALRSVGV